MRGTANTSAGGNYCGRAVHGVSSLSLEDMRQIEAHRAKDRPTPWAHLALRYNVNEIDLRTMFVSAANDDQPAPVAVVPLAPPRKPKPRCLSEEREALFRVLWTSDQPKSEIQHRMALSQSQVDRLRAKLGLPARQEGRKPNCWTDEESAYVLRHYVAGGVPADAVAQKLPGRSHWAVIGHAHRMGWTRTSHPSVRA